MYATHPGRGERGAEVRRYRGGRAGEDTQAAGAINYSIQRVKPPPPQYLDVLRCGCTAVSGETSTDIFDY